MPWRICLTEITEDKYRNYIIKFRICLACHKVKTSLEDWSTLKPFNSFISGEDLIGPSAEYSEGLPEQIKCKFSNLHLREILR